MYDSVYRLCMVVDIDYVRGGIYRLAASFLCWYDMVYTPFAVV